MALNTTNSRAVLALLGWTLLCVSALSWGQSDPILNNGGLPGTSGAGNASAAAVNILGEQVGRLTEALMVIFGIYYTLKGVLAYAKISSGRQSAQGDTMGGVMSHLVAGILAYHSRAFFSMVHNTVPMLPDFGRLVYDAELMRSLMQ